MAEAGMVAGKRPHAIAQKVDEGRVVFRCMGRIFALICVMGFMAHRRIAWGTLATSFPAICNAGDSASCYWYIQLKRGGLCSALDDRRDSSGDCHYRRCVCSSYNSHKVCRRTHLSRSDNPLWL